MLQSYSTHSKSQSCRKWSCVIQSLRFTYGPTSHHRNRGNCPDLAGGMLSPPFHRVLGSPASETKKNNRSSSNYATFGSRWRAPVRASPPGTQSNRQTPSVTRQRLGEVGGWGIRVLCSVPPVVPNERNHRPQLNDPIVRTGTTGHSNPLVPTVCHCKNKRAMIHVMVRAGRRTVGKTTATVLVPARTALIDLVLYLRPKPVAWLIYSCIRRSCDISRLLRLNFELKNI